MTRGAIELSWSDMRVAQYVQLMSACTDPRGHLPALGFRRVFKPGDVEDHLSVCRRCERPIVRRIPSWHPDEKDANVLIQFGGKLWELVPTMIKEEP